ncbi:MerR family transcriptional regulator [Noviherbaspirillum soli]|uniref:MerR family transcriptional regulator n=1 Tax=Noviherbaspirillum soli TaxID=1064518 RepID=UPI00188B6442|nr:MerR family transcriptional regulator [Noviherbaspirillum soli]
MAQTLTISQLARLASVNVETIRFYERQGLISKPPRGSSGFRHFPYEAVDAIRFIRVAKSLGFSLPEIQKLIKLRSSQDAQTKEDVRDLEATLNSINEKIGALTVLRDDLVSLKR